MKPPTTLRDESKEEMNCIFIHSAVDDAGLTPSEFRVYSHIARRASGGQAWPGIASMAVVCKMHPDTIRACIKALMARRMITRKDRPGFTPIYTVTKPSRWIYPSETKGGGIIHPSEDKGGGVSLEGIGDPPETKGGEGNPMKEIQKDDPRGIRCGAEEIKRPTIKTPSPSPKNGAAPLPELPEELKHLAPEWERWQAHRREIKKPLTAETAREHIELMDAMSDTEVREAIRYSINGGYPALYPPKKRAGASTQPAECRL